MRLSNQNVAQLRRFASGRAQRHADVKAEVAKLLVVQSVTQPNSRSTVELHRFAADEQARAAQWARLAGGVR